MNEVEIKKAIEELRNYGCRGDYFWIMKDIDGNDWISPKSDTDDIIGINLNNFIPTNEAGYKLLRESYDIN